MMRSRLIKALRETIAWLAFASGDASALELIERNSRPRLADQMAEILGTVARLDQAGGFVDESIQRVEKTAPNFAKEARSAWEIKPAGA